MRHDYSLLKLQLHDKTKPICWLIFPLYHVNYYFVLLLEKVLIFKTKCALNEAISTLKTFLKGSFSAEQKALN